MVICELLGSVARVLRAHKLRSFLTLLGVIIGVMTIVVVVGSIIGLNAYVADEMAVLAPDVYTVQRFGMIASRKDYMEALKRPPFQWGMYSGSARGSSSTPPTSPPPRARAWRFATRPDASRA